MHATRSKRKKGSYKIAIAYSLSPDRERIDINSVIEGVKAVKSVLDQLGHRPFLLMTAPGIPHFLKTLSLEKADLVFNLCEGYEERSEGEYWIAGTFELLGIPYTGSGPLTLALALDKSRAKQIFIANGIPTPRYALYREFSKRLPPLRFPMILKLAREDASLGISRENLVHGQKAFFKRLRALTAEYRSPVLVEEFIDGREFTVALLNGKPIALEEIDFYGEPRLLCYRAKWATGSPEDLGTVVNFTPKLTRKQRRQILDLSVRAYETLEIRDYGRVDLRMNRRGELFVLEVNPNPDITSNGGYRRSLGAAGILYEDFIALLVQKALGRMSK